MSFSIPTMPVSKQAAPFPAAGRAGSSSTTLNAAERLPQTSDTKTGAKPIYRSIYAGVVREKAKKVKHERDTFGLADYKGTVATDHFLRKGAFYERFAVLCCECSACDEAA